MRDAKLVQEITTASPASAINISFKQNLVCVCTAARLSRIVKTVRIMLLALLAMPSTICRLEFAPLVQVWRGVSTVLLQAALDAKTVTSSLKANAWFAVKSSPLAAYAQIRNARNASHTSISTGRTVHRVTFIMTSVSNAPRPNASNATLSFISKGMTARTVPNSCPLATPAQASTSALNASLRPTS